MLEFVTFGGEVVRRQWNDWDKDTPIYDRLAFEILYEPGDLFYADMWNAPCGE